MPSDRGVRKTIGSQEPCSFCGGRRWVPWFVGGPRTKLDTEALALGGDPIVDLGDDDGSDLADECARCGAVVSTSVEVAV